MSLNASVSRSRPVALWQNRADVEISNVGSEVSVRAGPATMDVLCFAVAPHFGEIRNVVDKPT